MFSLEMLHCFGNENSGIPILTGCEAPVFSVRSLLTVGLLQIACTYQQYSLA